MVSFLYRKLTEVTALRGIHTACISVVSLALVVTLVRSKNYWQAASLYLILILPRQDALQGMGRGRGL